MDLDGPQFGINECLYELSKSLKWKITLVKSKEDKCDKLKCVSFKTLHKLDLRLSSDQSCDSKNGKFLDGRLTAKIIHGLINDGEGRGAHYGKFQLTSVSGNIVSGQLWGITNAGTHISQLVIVSHVIKKDTWKEDWQEKFRKVGNPWLNVEFLDPTP